MRKVMIFIDGSWLYYSKHRLGGGSEKDFYVDYGRLPALLCDALKSAGGCDELDVCRCHLFGTFPWNHDERDQVTAQKQRDFFDMLRDRHFYDVDAFPVDYRGRRLLRGDRPEIDRDFEPRERWLEVSLASTMMYYAALPDGFDVALLVAGDTDFIPLLRRVRQLGKRTAIATIRGGCCMEFAETANKLGIRDYPVLWLDDFAADLELRLTRRQLPCESPLHEGEREVWTTFQPRPGEQFFCDACRWLFGQEQRREDAGREIQPMGLDHSDTGEMLSGKIKATFPPRGFGFICASNLCDYFFHNSDLEEGVRIEDLEEGQEVVFEVRRSAAVGKAGAARNVSVQVSFLNE